MKIGDSHEFFKNLDQQIKNSIKEHTNGIEKLLNIDDTFNFSCYKQGDCCKGRYDNPIMLNPYDAFKLRKSLNVNSMDFIDKYAELTLGKNSKYPIMLLKTNEESNEDWCIFLKENGCSVYDSRPTVCRTYPIGRMKGKDESYFFMVNTNSCCQSGCGKTHTLKSWLEETNSIEYLEWSDKFSDLIYSVDFEKYQKSDIEYKYFLGEILYNYDNIKNTPQLEILNNFNSINKTKNELETIYSTAKSYCNLFF